MMTKLRTLVAGVVIAALAFAGGVFAQVSNLAPTSFSGAEAIVVAALGPGSASEYATSGMFRNTTGGIIQTAITGTNPWPVPVLGGSVTVPTSAAPFSTLVFTGVVGTMTQNLPATPFDGQMAEILNGNAAAMTALTVATTDGSATVNFGAALALAGGTSAEFYYLKSNNTWYRKR